MRIMVEIGHPKQVHFWKNIFMGLEENGHEIKVMAKEKDITLYLLNKYGIKYELLGKNYKGIPRKAYGLFESTFKVMKTASKFRPDLFIGGPSFAQTSRLFKKQHIALSDTEHAMFHIWLTFQFSDIICTPMCFKGRVNPKKHITYNGYEELAYLHPNYFKPDASVLDELGLEKQERFIFLRFVSWNASHDIGQHGIKLEAKRKYISKLEQYGRVIISSESKIDREFEKYKVKIPPEKIHTLLSYAQLYVGESGAMTTEAAILGTPSVYVSSLVGTMGNFIELEDKYGLVYSFNSPESAIEKASDLLKCKDIKNIWQSKREKLLSEKIDVTKFMIELIENCTNNLK